MIEARQIAAGKIGKSWVLTSAEVARVQQMRAGARALGLVASLVDAAPHPLPVMQDVVVELSVGMTELVHVRAWSSNERVVVVLASADPQMPALTHTHIAALTTQLDQQVLGGRGEEAVWFSLEPERTAYGEPGLDIRNLAGQWPTVADRHTHMAPDVTRYDSTVTEILRVTGLAELPVFAWPVASREVIEAVARCGQPLAVPCDRYGVRPLLRSMRALARCEDDMARLIAAILARSVAERLDWQSGEVERGTWDDGQIAIPGVVMAATAAPLALPAADTRLIDAALTQGPAAPAGQEALIETYLRIRGWQTDHDDSSPRPDAALAQAADEAALLIRRQIGSDIGERQARALAYPAAKVIEQTVVGLHDRAYLASLIPAEPPRNQPSWIRLDRTLQQLVDYGLVTDGAWSWGYDNDGHLVAVAPDQSRYLVAWPISLPAAGLPDTARLVADGDTGDRPVYITYPDGTYRLLPHSTSTNDGWNFGYSGGGPGMLAGDIARAYCADRQIPYKAVPVTWIDDACCHASLETLVADISRRIRPAGIPDLVDAMPL